MQEPPVVKNAGGLFHHVALSCVARVPVVPIEVDVMTTVRRGNTPLRF
jgi:hypothetical protein